MKIKRLAVYLLPIVAISASASLITNGNYYRINDNGLRYILENGKIKAVRLKDNKIIWNSTYPIGDSIYANSRDGRLLVIINNFEPMTGIVNLYSGSTGRIVWTKKFDTTLSRPLFVGDKLVLSRFTNGEGHYSITHIIDLKYGNVKTIIGSPVATNNNLILIRPSTYDPFIADRLTYTKYNTLDSQENIVNIKINSRSNCGGVKFPISKEGVPTDPRAPSLRDRFDSNYIYVTRLDECGVFDSKYNWINQKDTN